MNKRKILIICAIFALIIGIAPLLLPETNQPKTWKDVLPKPEHTKVDETKPLREQTRTIELAGRTFEIPLMYVDGALKPGVKQDSLLLEVVWPDMRSIYELKDKAEYERIWKEEKRRGWILLEPASMRPSLNKQIDFNEHTETKVDFIEKVDGLEKYLWYYGTPEKPELWAELHIFKDESGQIKSFNMCRVGNGVKVPICHDKFINDGIIYDISYSKDNFFPEWREQQTRAIDFLNSFENNQTTQQPIGGERQEQL